MFNPKVAIMAHYQCPFCNQHQAITDPKVHQSVVQFLVRENVEGPIGAQYTVRSCANPKCRKTTIHLVVGKLFAGPLSKPALNTEVPYLFNARIIPRAAVREFPSYIPAPLLEDYREACLIQELSPKAAATLVRRCLQGMIRDFCGISKNRLVDEIAELKRLVEADTAPKGVLPETVEAIDHVRNIGNIGAHMEKDIGLIVPVDQSEARALIGLVEMLFDEWYIARNRREERLAEIKGTALQKEALRSSTKGLLSSGTDGA